MVQRKPIVAKVEITQEPAEDYSNKIKVAREKLGLTHEELGKKINEKASVLRNLEAGKMAPNNQLASKLEHMLKIKLLVPISEEKVPPPVSKSANQELTLGDVIEIDSKDGEVATERKPS
jgi:putative transcription factor